MGPYRSSDKTHFLLNRLLTFSLCVFDFRFFECCVRIVKFVLWFFLIKASEASHFFVFQLLDSLLRLSTSLHVKDLIKLKARARALRFFNSMKYKVNNALSVPDRPSEAVPDRPCLSSFWVPDRPCLITTDINLLTTLWVPDRPCLTTAEITS